MDLNWLLFWMTLLTCVVMLLRLPRGRMYRDRRRLAGALLGLALIGYLWFPQSVGFVVGGLWLTTLLGAAVGTRLVGLCLARRRFLAAERLSQAVSIVYPLDGFASYAQFIRAALALHQGRFSHAQQLLEQLALHPHSLGWNARVLLARITGDWASFLSWVESRPSEERPLHDPTVLEAYLQGLGERGEFQRQCLGHERWMERRAGQVPVQILNLARMKLAAFAGDRLLVEQMQSTIPDLSTELREFWLATALQAAGRPGEAEPAFLPLVGAGDARVAEAALQRLSRPILPPDFESLERFRREIRPRIVEAVGIELGFAATAQRRRQPAWAVRSIAFLLILMFLREVPGGATEIENLIGLGALIVPVEAGDGDWTRVITAAFLHFGAVHLVLNLGGLALFGRRLEWLWGRIPLLVTYLVTAIGSVALVPWTIAATADQEPFILVGASGGVMGLIGALLGFQACGLWSRHSPLLMQEFQLLLVIVAAQSLFDLLTPNVSAACHLLGLGLGLVIGVLMGCSSGSISRTIDGAP